MKRVFFCGIAVVVFTLAPIFQAGAASVKFRVSNPAIAQALIARGAHLIADYESFQLLESETQIDSTEAEAVPEYDVVELNARPLNTRVAAVQALRRPVISFAGKRLHLIHFAG